MFLTLQTGLIINLFLIAMFVLFILIGYKKGFLVQLIDFLGLIVCLFIAWLFSGAFGKLFSIFPKGFTPFNGTVLSDFFYQQLNSVVWFMIIFIVCWIIVKLLKIIVKQVDLIPIVSTVNKVLGIAFAGLRLLLLSFVMVFFLVSPLFRNGNEVIEGSLLKYFRQYGMETIDFIAKPVGELTLVQEFMENPKQVSEEDVKKIITWFESNGIDQQTINEFFIQIGL